MPRRAALLLVAALAGCGSGADPAARSAVAPARTVATPQTTAARPAGPPAGWLTGRRARAAHVPILMFHVVGRPAAGTALPGLVVSPEIFARQMRALDRAGFTAVRMDRVLDAWAGHGALPPRPVVLSFDDGYLGDALFAGRVLRRRGWPGVLNLTLENVGADGLPAWGVRRLVRDGWELESHTLTHPDLRTASDAMLVRELAGSRRALRRRFGAPARVFTYPAGKYDDRVIAAVRDAGYRAALTEVPGTATRSSPAFELPRIRVEGQMQPAALLAAIRGTG